jgi:hypothetical protein
LLPQRRPPNVQEIASVYGLPSTVKESGSLFYAARHLESVVLDDSRSLKNLITTHCWGCIDEPQIDHESAICSAFCFANYDGAKP